MIPIWLHILAIVSLASGIVCAAAIARDIAENPQPMAIMNLVWPISALYGGVLALVIYLLTGVRARQSKPLATSVAAGTTHCGAGCTLGDIAAEWLCLGAPIVALWFGWQSIFGEKMFAVWIVDFIFAFGFGIVFQYFAIAPMRGLSFWPGIAAALKADTLSLTAWQVGMYGFMALAQYAYFRPLTGKMLEVNTPEFWFTMQLAMLCGFVTSYPVNWWLIDAGLKEKM
jgi:hypothetical protein